MWKETLVFIATFACCLAEVSLAPLEAKPDEFRDETGCYISDLNTVIAFNTSIASSKECLEYSCGMKFVTFSSCGVGAALPPCELVEDKEKPYPDCCPRVECPEEVTTPNTTSPLN
ncbi:hypothetical protein K1T71_002962 [Dendrolimus kikuchii]|uniref:Uncharacterized protein n=1 Tax=Dendrolimus kikuchii TaxID=765133 RepID=A0ACC1DBT9_9NEOP|nr:hypothetical protein K1T71_002962 [Dendrolimus kikuchii]